MTDSQARGSRPFEGSAARLQVIATAVLFSTGGAAIKAVSAPAAVIAAGRSAVAGILVFLLLRSTRRLPSVRMLGVSLAYAMTLMLFVFSNKTTTAAAAIFLQSTSPFWVALLGPLLLRESVARRDLLTLPFLLGCMVLLFLGRDPASAIAPRPLLGNFLALSAGLCFGLVLLGLRGLSRHQDQGAQASMAWGNLLVVLLCLPLIDWSALWAGSAQEATFVFPWSAVVVLLYLGTVQVGLAYLLLARAARSIPAFEVSLLLLLEPSLSPVWAYLVHGETPGWPTLVGGSGIVGISLARMMSGRRRS